MKRLKFNALTVLMENVFVCLKALVIYHGRAIISYVRHY